MRLPIRSARYTLPAALALWLVSPAAPQAGYTENGLASWYGYPYHGQSSASGETYDMDTFTAAHPTLPFNTLVRVVNLANDKSVQVRIIDRGPYVGGRIIDLSRAAAQSIGIMEAGTARVRVEVIGPAGLDPHPLAPSPVFAVPDPRPVVADPRPVLFAVQTGAFRIPANAQRYFALMQTRYGAARLVAPEQDSGIWRVLVGGESTREAAEALAARIRHDSGENNALLVRLDSSHEPDRPGQSSRPRGTVAADSLRTPLD